MTHTETLLQWLCDEMRPLLIRPREHGGVGWCKVDCVRTAKMALAMLKAYNIEAVHMPVSLFAANRVVGKYLKRFGRSILSLQASEIRRLSRPRLFRMGRLSPTEDCTSQGGWRGHMVLVVEGKYFLDMTIDSTNQKYLQGFKPFWNALPPNVLDALKKPFGGEFTITVKSGSIATYRGDPNNQAFATMDAWTAWHELHESILQQCKSRFDAIKEK